MSHVYRRLLADFGRNHLLPGFVKVRDRYSEARLVRSLSEAYEDLLGIKEVKQTQQIVLKVRNCQVDLSLRCPGHLRQMTF